METGPKPVIDKSLFKSAEVPYKQGLKASSSDKQIEILKILRDKSTDKLKQQPKAEDQSYHNIYATTDQNSSVPVIMSNPIPTKKKEDLMKKIIRLDKKEPANSSIVIMSTKNVEKIARKSRHYEEPYSPKIN